MIPAWALLAWQAGLLAIADLFLWLATTGPKGNEFLVPAAVATGIAALVEFVALIGIGLAAWKG